MKRISEDVDFICASGRKSNHVKTTFPGRVASALFISPSIDLDHVESRESSFKERTEKEKEKISYDTGRDPPLWKRDFATNRSYLYSYKSLALTAVIFCTNYIESLKMSGKCIINFSNGTNCCDIV